MQGVSILQDFKFLPGGRILAGAGTARNVALFNCFVMGTIEDYPFHDRDILVTACGRLCLHRKKI